MFKTYSFKTKLLLLCSFMAGISIVIAALSYRGLHNVETSNQRIVDIAAPNMNRVNSMMIHFNKIRVELRTLGLPGLTKADAEKAIKIALTEIEAFDVDMKAFEAIPFVPGEKELFDQLQKEWMSFKEIGGRVIQHYKSGTPADLEKMHAIFFKDCPEAAERFRLAIEALITFHQKNLDNWSSESIAIAERTNMMILSVSFVMIALSLSLGFYFANTTAKTMNEIVESLKGSAEDVSSAATQIAASSEQLSQATTEQAASLQETSSSIEEINSMINSNTENAKQSEHSATLSLQSAEKGKETVEKMIRAIERINESNSQIMVQIDQSNKEMEDIVKVINEIGTKTKVINDIVFQTKLLSFNASVEAARAGEMGKGFAVVAEEVGNLAAMSGSAAVEISQMLETSVGKVENIVKNSREKMSKLIADGKESVEAGNKVADECGEVLNEIVSSVAVVTKSVGEISVASQEQASGVQEITKAIAQLDQVTQENTSSAAESANAADSLSAQAEKLKQLVQSLVVTMEGIKSEAEIKQAQVIPFEKKTKEVRKKARPLSTDVRFKDV